MPKYGLFTPLVLYAHKLYNNIGYDRWDTTPNPYLHAFLGTTLYEAFVTAITNGRPAFLKDKTEIKELRKIALTYKTGAKQGQQDKATSHRCNLQTLDIRTKEGTKPMNYSKYAVMSFLQLWLCNAQLRDTDAMILDLYDWGNIPKGYDAVVAKVKHIKVPKEKTALDDLWDIL